MVIGERFRRRQNRFIFVRVQTVAGHRLMNTRDFVVLSDRRVHYIYVRKQEIYTIERSKLIHNDKCVFYTRDICISVRIPAIW